MTDAFDGRTPLRNDPWGVTPVDLTPRSEPLPALRLTPPEFPPGYVAPEPEPLPNLEHSGWNLPFAPPPVTREDLLS